jgi:hypothetical protein
MTRKPPLQSAILIFAILTLAGCTQPTNDRLSLGGLYITPTFQTPKPENTPNTPQLFAATPKPRTAWESTIYTSPYDGVAHSRLMRTLPPLKRDDTPRSYGRFPTTDDALSEQSNSSTQDLTFAIQEMGRTFIGTPFALGYFLTTGQLTTPSIAPDRSWKRTRQDGWSSGHPNSAPTPTPEEPHDDE